MPPSGGYRRILEIPHDDVVGADISNVVRVFEPIAADGDSARAVRGHVFLAFPSYETDPRPNHLIPEIRRFVRALDAALPYFPYFLEDDPTIGHMLMYLLCLIELDVERGHYPVADLMEAVQRKRHDVAALCARIGDDADRATDSLFLNLPPQIAKHDPELVTRILKKMRPALVGFKTTLAAGRTLDVEMKVEFSNVLDRACVLASVDRTGHGSDLELIDELLAKSTPEVGKEELDRFQEAFDNALEAVKGRNRSRANTNKVRMLVRGQPGAAYRFVDVHVRMSASQPGYLQPAAVVAYAILAELGDRSALLQIERRAEELGVEADTWSPG